MTPQIISTKKSNIFALQSTNLSAKPKITLLMNLQAQINQYIGTQPQAKRSDMEELHHLILQAMPGCKLWFLDGKNKENKVVSNPNIGYGSYNILYADGKSKEFYQIGLSGNTTGISVYIMGVEDKKYLTQNFSQNIGKASVTGYCIKFKALKDINIDILLQAIKYGVASSNCVK